MAQTTLGQASVTPSSSDPTVGTLVYGQIIITGVASTVTPSQFTYSETDPSGNNLDLHLVYSQGTSIPPGGEILFINPDNNSTLPTTKQVTTSLTDGTIYIYPNSGVNSPSLTDGSISYTSVLQASSNPDTILFTPSLTYTSSSGVYNYTLSATIVLPNTSTAPGTQQPVQSIVNGNTADLMLSIAYGYDYAIPDSAPPANWKDLGTYTEYTLATYTFTSNYFFTTKTIGFNSTPARATTKRVKGLATTREIIIVIPT